MKICALLAEHSAAPVKPLASLLRSRGAEVLSLSADLRNPPPEDLPATVPWNSPSALSAHTVVLEAHTRCGGITAGLFAFDGASFASLYSDPADSDPAIVIERLVTGWILLVDSVRERFLKRGSGHFIFVHCVPNPKAEAVEPLPLPVSVAEAAFVRFAEETAARDRDGVRTSLVRYETGGEGQEIEWLADRVFDGPPARSNLRWVRAGSRGLFGPL